MENDEPTCKVCGAEATGFVRDLADADPITEVVNQARVDQFAKLGWKSLTVGQEIRWARYRVTATRFYCNEHRRYG